MRSNLLSLLLIITLIGARDVFAHPFLPIDSGNCETRMEYGDNLMANEKFDSAYSLFKGYIETCYPSLNAFAAFGQVRGANDFRSNDKRRFAEFASWLMKVLYLRSDTDYYCADVRALLGSFTYINDQRQFDMNGFVSVVKYLIETNKCPMLNKSLYEGWASGRRAQYQVWKDTVTVDTMLYRMDSTTPSLSEIGLDILRDPKFASVQRAFAHTARAHFLPSFSDTLLGGHNGELRTARRLHVFRRAL